MVIDFSRAYLLVSRWYGVLKLDDIATLLLEKKLGLREDNADRFVRNVVKKLEAENQRREHRYHE